MKRTAPAILVIALSIIILAAALLPLSKANPGSFEIEWERQLPGTSGNSVVQTPEGGYLVLGTNASIQVNEGGEKMYTYPKPILLKLDSSGNLMWQKTYNFEGESLELFKIIPTSDGGFALGGMEVFNTTQPGKMSTFTNKLALLKIDPQGNLQWNKLLPSYNNSYSDVSTGLFGDFIQTSDGGYAFASGFNHMMYLNEIWFVKANYEGELEYSIEVNSPLGGPVSLAQREDKGYSIVGGIIGRGGSGGRIGIVRIDSEGSTLGNELYGEEYDQQNPYARCASPTQDGGFIIGGYFGVTRKAWILKTDAQDHVLWDKTPQFDDAYTAFNAISQTQDGKYAFIAGATETNSVTYETKYYTWAGKLNETGSLESQKYFLGASSPETILQTDDGGYVFVGTWRLNDIGNQKIWLLKFSPKIIPSEKLPSSISILSPENRLYPLGNISLTYTIDPTVKQVEYSLNDQAKAQLEENTTIIGLPQGQHVLKLYGQDGFGNVQTAHINFSVGEPLPTLIIIEIAILIIIVAIVSFILGTKINGRKSKTDKKPTS